MSMENPRQTLNQKDKMRRLFSWKGHEEWRPRPRQREARVSEGVSGVSGGGGVGGVGARGVCGAAGTDRTDRTTGTGRIAASPPLSKTYCRLCVRQHAKRGTVPPCPGEGVAVVSGGVSGVSGWGEALAEFARSAVCGGGFQSAKKKAPGCRGAFWVGWGGV